MYSDISFIKSAHKANQFVPDFGVEIAFAGRSNAGKSSAINAITGRRGLARTSKIPGRTQLVNFFQLGDGKRLVDLPGYGYAKVPDAVRAHWRELMAEYFQERESLKGMMLIMDVRRPLMEFDQQMLEWAGACNLAVHALLTKADKLSKGAGAKQLRMAERELEGSASVQLFSATKGIGLAAARAAMERILKSRPVKHQKKAPV